MDRKNNELYQFTAQLEQADEHKRAAFVSVPLDVEKLFGTRGQVKVRATFDGVPYRGVIAPMGTGAHCLGVLQQIRREIGKAIGDSVAVTLEIDREERTVEIPKALQRALKTDKAAEEFFASLSYTNRKEYALWISTAVKEETRDRRLALTIEKLRAKKANPSVK